MTEKKTENSILDSPVDPKTPEFNVNFSYRRKTMNDIELLTAEQLLTVLKISEPTLHGLVKRNEIPHFYVGKKSLRFNKASIIDWLRKLENAGGAA
jgi:predicted DNA-binding transcriptional regulator AlpA